MSTLISMIRGINVGGRKKVRMKDLVSLYESLNFSHVRTYLQSGNVLFAISEKDTGELSALIEEKIKERFGFEVRVIVRTVDELRRIVNDNPFLSKGEEDTGKLHVTFLSDLPAVPSLPGQIQTKDNIDYYSIAGREVYLYCPTGYGRTLLSNSFFEKELGVSATTRNWQTTRKLLELAQAE